MKYRKAILRMLSFVLTLCLLLPAAASCQKEELEENQLAVTWHLGMVTSDQHKESPCTILDGVEEYSYSDIITIPKMGTRITFVDDNGPESVDGAYATEQVFVISHWVEEDGEWVLEHPGDNYTGIEGRSGEIAKIVRGESATYSYVSSYDEEHIRLCYRSGQTAEDKPRKFPFAKVYAEVTFEEGTLISSKSNVLKDIEVSRFLKTAKDTCWYEELEGITMYTMGDSYFGGSTNGKPYVWPNLMAQKYGMTFSNWGIGGSTVSDKGYEPMCNRISSMSSGDPQIVLLEGGRNDFNVGCPIGTATDALPNTFYGAVNNCIDQLKAKYPNALIIGITCWKVNEVKNGVEQQAFADAMLDACAKKGIPCFDATDESVTGVHMNEYSFRTKYCQNSGDVSHLNTAGMILVEPAFEKFIAEQYRAFLAAQPGA